MELHRFHFLYGLHFVRKRLLLCLLPLAGALAKGDWPGLALALKQEAALLALLFAAGFWAWRQAGWRLEKGSLTVKTGLFVRRYRHLPCARLAGVAVNRPVLFRLVGAGRVTLYLRWGRPRRFGLCLPRQTARDLASALMPESGTVSLCFARRLARHRIFLREGAALCLFAQSPRGRRKGRGTLWVKLPAGLYRLPRFSARDLPLQPPKKGRMSMFKTVIFDLDGTLLNTLDDLALASNLVCKAHGWPTHSTDAFKYFVGNGKLKLVERFTPPQHRTPETLVAAVEEFNAAYAAHKEDSTAPYPGIPELLARLKEAGIATGVVSNKDDGPTKAVVEHYLPGLITAARGRVEELPAKPHPAGVFALMEKLGADPETTLYVGDSDVDIFTARNAGLPSCGVLWGFRTREELASAGATHLAATAAELEALIFEEAE